MKKILVFGERYFHYTDSTVYALEQLGFEVKVVYMPLLQSKELSIWEHLQYKINRNSFCQKYYEHKKLQIQNEVSEYKPDIFFSINGNAYYEFIDKNLIMMLRDIKCKSYVWYMDTVKRFENIEQNIRLFDEVLSFEPMDVAYAKEKYDKEARYLPIGVAEQLFCKSSKSEKKYDVSFVGNSTENRLAVLDEVAKYCTANNKSMIVFGHYWHNKHFWQAYFAKRSFARKHPDLVKYVTNSFLHDQEVAELYNTSRISLNIHIALHKGINPRTFEVLGNGNFELCDYREDAEKMGLVDGKNIVMYNNAEECVEKIKCYLNNEEEYLKIAKAGKEFVIKNYTMKKLLADVLKKDGLYE